MTIQAMNLNVQNVLNMLNRGWEIVRAKDHRKFQKCELQKPGQEDVAFPIKVYNRLKDKDLLELKISGVFHNIYIKKVS